MTTLTAVRHTTTVHPGGVVVVQQSELAPGAQVEVIVMADSAALTAGPTLSTGELRAGLAQALTEAGYDTAEKIIALVREVKREQAEAR